MGFLARIQTLPFTRRELKIITDSMPQPWFLGQASGFSSLIGKWLVQVNSSSFFFWGGGGSWGKFKLKNEITVSIGLISAALSRVLSTFPPEKRRLDARAAKHVYDITLNSCGASGQQKCHLMAIIHRPTWHSLRHLWLETFVHVPFFSNLFCFMLSGKGILCHVL